MKQGRDAGHTIVWQYIIFGYNEHEIDRAIEIAKEEDFSLLFINTNTIPPNITKTMIININILYLLCFLIGISATI